MRKLPALFIGSKVAIISMLLLGHSLLAQEGIEYLDFTVKQESGKAVFVEWVVKQGRTCNDPQIWRSDDSLNFENIFTYVGVCGSADSSIRYSYTDPDVNSGNEYYYQIRVQTERTEIRKVLILPDQKIDVYPNPGSGLFNVIMPDQSPETRLKIFDLGGRKMDEFTLNQNINSIELINYKRGIYIYSYVNSEISGSGRLFLY